MEKKMGTKPGTRPGARAGVRSDAAPAGKMEQKKRMKKLSEYGKQLQEKQKVKRLYGVAEAQFKRFFKMAAQSETATGEGLLTLLERRLDNVLYRLKLASTRPQARQAIVHGLVIVNGKKVSSPSYLVDIQDEIGYKPAVAEKKAFLESAVDKRLNTQVKVPDWVELSKNDRVGKILRLPVRSDIQTPIEEHLIVELYSK